MYTLYAVVSKVEDRYSYYRSYINVGYLKEKPFWIQVIQKGFQGTRNVYVSSV